MTQHSEQVRNFQAFSKKVQELKLDENQFVASAHHSNGSGRDWEALNRPETRQAESNEATEESSDAGK